METGLLLSPLGLITTVVALALVLRRERQKQAEARKSVRPVRVRARRR